MEIDFAREAPWFLCELEGANPGEATRWSVTELTRRMGTGDDAAFTEFHRRYFNRMFRYAFVLCRGNEANAQEVVQEALLRVVRYVKPKPDETVLWNWLTVLLRSAGADLGRKQTRYRNLCERFRALFVWESQSPGSDHLQENDPSAMLAAALTALNEDDRIVIERKYFERHSYRQLAADWRTTERAMEGRVARLRQKLKAIILRDLRNGPTRPRT